MNKVICCAAVLVAVIITAPTLRADDSTSDRERERQQAKVEKEQDIYEEGSDAIDEQDWRRAAKQFQKVAEMRMAHADAALFWLAFAQNKMGMRSEALSTVLQLQNSYPKSKWNEDAKHLELEIRQSAGQRIEPDRVDDEELKLMALNGLMNSDPERAVPILDRVLQTSKSTKMRDKALFILSQSSSSQAQEILTRVAKNNADRDLQKRAVRYLGMMGGERNRKLLAELYNSSNDIEIKKSVLKSYMISGDRAHLLAIAKSETNPELRSEAVMQLGISGGRTELAELYNTETSVEVRKKIIQAMFIGGNADKLYDIARNEPVLDLKLTAIRNLGLLGGEKSSQFLVTLYTNDTRDDVREAVIHSLFIQGNARGLVELARREKNPALKKAIISKLSLMNSRDAADYLMEYLKD